MPYDNTYMWNLKYDVKELIYKTETNSQRAQVCDCQGMGGDMDQEFGIHRNKLLYIERINNKVLLFSSGNYSQYPMINHNGNEYEKEHGK